MYSELSNCANFLNFQVENFEECYCKDFGSRQEQLDYCDNAKYKIMAIKAMASQLLDKINEEMELVEI